MHPYSHYIDEISKNELFNSLVGCGLFAEKLPDYLQSNEFLIYTEKLSLPLDIKPEDYIRYSSIRNTNIPRPISIPAPFSYANLCYELKSNWSKLQRYYKKQTKSETHKVSRIHLRKMNHTCALFEMNYKNYEKDGFPEQELLIKSKYVVNADISKCFPSIYSHSIPWALVGKKKAKESRDPGLWHNKLDTFLRNSKYGETNGLHIGPHASNLISEIPLTAVDREMVKERFRYIRHIDDYTCYVESYEEAERFLLKLSEELGKYELLLNEKKTEIIPLPMASVKQWVNQLNHFNFINSYDYNGKEAITTKALKGFLDFVIELMLEENSDASILYYAIKIIANKHLGINAKNYFVKQIHHLVLIYPYLVNIIDEFVFEIHSISNEKVKKITNDLYHYGLMKNMFEACAHSLYWAMKYDFTIDHHKIKENSIKSGDCVFMLSSYLYCRKTHSKLFLKDFQEKAKELKKIDFDRYWLFIYTVLPWSDLPTNYKEMRKDKIYFIKEEYRYKNL